MQFMLDHLVGVVIAAIAILILIAMQFRGQDTSIDSTKFVASKTRMLDLVQFVEQDISNLGSSIDSVKYAIQGFDTTGTPAYFTFSGRTSQADPAAHTIRYEWEVTGDTYLQSRGSVPTYTVERIIDGTISGSSMNTITGFRIDLMAADSSAIGGNFADTRLVAVAVSAASPVGASNVLEETKWSKVFRPVNMTRQ